MSKIRTYMGHMFDVTNSGTIDIHDIAHSLSMQCRYVGHTPKFYSVAEHCIMMSYMCAERKWALLHDASEAYLSDLAAPIKDIPEISAAYKPLEEKLMRKIADRFMLPWPMPEIVHSADMEMRNAEMNHFFGLGETHSIRPFCYTPEEAEKLFLSRFTELF